jgi:hypothetical protein
LHCYTAESSRAASIYQGSLAAKRHKKRKKGRVDFCAFCAFLRPLLPWFGFGCGPAALRSLRLTIPWHGVWLRLRRSVARGHQRIGTILVARSRIIDGLGRMGAKYLPTIKDIKASQRFQQKQSALPKLKKASGNQPKKKREKK